MSSLKGCVWVYHCRRPSLASTPCSFSDPLPRCLCHAQNTTLVASLLGSARQLLAAAQARPGAWAALPGLGLNAAYSSSVGAKVWSRA